MTHKLSLRIAVGAGLMILSGTATRADNTYRNAISSQNPSRVVSASELSKSSSSPQEDRLAVSATEMEKKRQSARIGGTRLTPQPGSARLSTLKPLKARASVGSARLAVSDWSKAFEGVSTSVDQPAGSLADRQFLQTPDVQKFSLSAGKTSSISQQAPSERIGVNFEGWSDK